VTETNKTIDSFCYKITRTYDSLNRVTSIRYPETSVNCGTNGELVNYIYDLGGSLYQVSSVTSGLYVQEIQYNAFGQRTSIRLGNWTYTNYSYDPNHFRLSDINTGGSVTLHRLNYSYDAVGNVTGITDNLNPANNQTPFVYDELNRLTSATGPYGSGGAQATLTYAYNQIGNMTCNSQISSCNATSPNYTYPASGASSIRPHAVSQAGSNTYTYDPNGNMLSGASRTMIYDSQNRPTSMMVGSTTTTMVYDYSGERMKKTANGVTTTYVSNLVECTSAGCTKYYFAGSTRIALKDSGGSVYYYHTDHLGSSTVVTNSSGTSVQTLAYYPYGSTRVNSGSQNVHHKYTGQELDDSTGLYYYGARYYDPVIGRFISPDKVGIKLGNPQTLNRYSYVLNNPLRYTDPDGQEIDERTGSVVEIIQGDDGSRSLVVVAGPNSPDSSVRGQTYVAEVNSSGQVTQAGWGENSAERGAALRAEYIRSGDPRVYAVPAPTVAPIFGNTVQTIGPGAHRPVTNLPLAFRDGTNFVPPNQRTEVFTPSLGSFTTQGSTGVYLNDNVHRPVAYPQGSFDVTFNAGNGIVGVSGQLSVTPSGIYGYVGGGWGIGFGASVTGSGNFGNSSGWGVTGSYSGGGIWGGTASGTLSQGGGSMNFGGGYGVGAGGSVTFGYSGAIWTWQP
jgi:RHS repeat-associated protein